LQALQMLRICLFGLANRRIPRTLCASFFEIVEKICKIIKKAIDIFEIIFYYILWESKTRDKIY
jgi:hypothetical protein